MMGDEERIKLYRGRMRVTVCVVSECVLFACRINFLPNRKYTSPYMNIKLATPSACVYACMFAKLTMATQQHAYYGDFFEITPSPKELD